MFLVIIQKMLLVHPHLQIVNKGDTTYRATQRVKEIVAHDTLFYYTMEKVNNKEVTTDLVTDRANQKLLGSNPLSCLCNCHCFY